MKLTSHPASILFPVLVFTSIVSTFILSGLISLFLVHRFYLHLRAASSSSGQFQFSLDSTLAAIVDFGIETAARVGIDIQSGSATLKIPSSSSSTASTSVSKPLKTPTNGGRSNNRAHITWAQLAQNSIHRDSRYDLGRPVSAQAQESKFDSASNEMTRTSTSERLAALVAAKEALAALEKNSIRSNSLEMDEKAQVGNDVVVPTITFQSPQ